MQDQELFELCKEVYRRTGWRLPISERPVEYWVQHDDEWDLEYGVAGLPVDGGIIPLYTSDYLLDMLPKKLPHHNHYDYLTVWADSDTDWNAAYELNDDCENFDFAGDTPLEALLHLVIALDDAGQLKGDK